MKKFATAAICCLALSLSSVMAQNQMPQGGRPMRGMMRGGATLIADTTITNHMNLTPEQTQQIMVINDNYRAQMQAAMSGNHHGDGQHMSREDREARMQQVQGQRKEARKQLRAVLGDDLYIEYLELSLDRVPMMGGQRGGHGVAGPHGVGGPRGPQGRGATPSDQVRAE